MRKIYNLLLVALMAVSLCACSDKDSEEAFESELVGKTIPLTATILILDLNEENQISRSPTAQTLGFVLSLETLSGCTGCNYYQGGKFRQMLSPGAQVTISSAYKAVPPKMAVDASPVNYFVVADADGAKFVMPEYELEIVTAGGGQKLRPEAMLLERLLAEYDDPGVQKPFFLKVQPNWLKQGHPELTQPYTSQAVATYFNPLVAGMAAGSFSGLEIHPEEFFIALKANKVALGNIILHTEGLKFDIIPAYGLTLTETPAPSTP